MEKNELINFCIKKGLLVDKEVLSIFNDIEDLNSVKLIIQEIKNKTQKSIITKESFNNIPSLIEIFSELPKKNQKSLEKLKIKLGLNIEISKEYSSNLPNNENIKNLEKEIKNTSDLDENEINSNKKGIRIVESFFSKSKKLNVGDFVNYFRNRFSEMKCFLQDHLDLVNLVSINKLSNNIRNSSLIGIVSSKSITKNKNIILEIEDLTGKIKILINKDKKEIYEKSQDISLDSVLGFRGSGNREIFFAEKIVFPEAVLSERKKSNIEEFAIFIGDLHIGSNKFMEENFLRFIDYLNGKIPGTEEEVSKIKYIFIVGDLIAGVGNYPGQEFEISLPDLESHFIKAAELLDKIPKNIEIIFSPGNHDGIRLMEPQPILDEKYAWPIFNLKNITLTTNPSLINIASNSNFEGFNILMYHGYSFFYYADNVNSLIINKAAHKPELIMKYLLKNRHLAPTHGSVQYFPSERDCHIIREIPDIFIAGHTHKSAVAYCNNILCISVSGWESLTSYMEKRGAKPDFCKVPLLNLKTRSIKILDFE
jgi:DNA polymerase II small subunit